MSRISRHQMFMEMARAASMRSTCFRLNVGALIVADKRPISVGYNGAPSGKPHCSGNDCPGRMVCEETIHAEQNALEHAPKVRGPWDLYSTHSPCRVCMTRIMWDYPQVKRVFFETLYRNSDHLVDFLTNKVGVYRVTPAGYVIDHISGDVVELP